MPQGWTVVPETPVATAAPAGWTPVAAPDFRQTDTSPNDLDPNTVGTLASHVVAQVNPIGLGQMIPFPKAAGGAGWDAPLKALQGIGAAHEAVAHKAKDAYDKGDYLTAGRHAIDYLIPVLGPVLDKSADAMQSGKYMAGLGDAIGLALALFGPHALPKGGKVAALESANPAEAAAVRFGQERGIPVDAGTATGNPAIKGLQQMADQSIAGSVVARGAKRAQAVALDRVGGELADQARGSAVTPEQAGQGIRDALASKVEAHTALGDHAYEQLRALEGQPENQMDFPLPKAHVDELPVAQRAELRRVVHELEREPFSPRLLQAGKYGGSLEHVEGTGGGGAKVYDDILGNLEGTYRPQRSVVQSEIEEYLGGGKPTAIAKAALEVAKDRAKHVGSEFVDPALAGDPLTRLEKGRVTTQAIGLPTDVTAAKVALKPVYDQMMRQMPITQQQANPGLKALQNILEGPDYAPLSQVDRDLSAIKALARQRPGDGLAKMAVARLDAAVRHASQSNPEAARLLTQGREAIKARAGAQDLVEALPGGKLEEPLAVFKRATAPQDAGIEMLRAVKDQTPHVLPQIARAKLDELLSMATADGGFNRTDKLYAEWQKLGSETKRTLFPQPGQAQALDHFFLLAKKMGENMNPSGTGQAVMHLGEVLGAAANPLALLATEVGSAGLSAILHTPRGVRAVSRVMTLRAPAAATVRTAAQSAGWAEVVAAARSAGVPMALPAAAGGEASR